MKIKGKLYQFNKDKRTYKSARDTCIHRGGKLFEPKTENVFNDVLQEANKRKLIQYWLGIYDKTKENNFVYDSDGTSVGWTKWRNGQPNNYKSNSGKNDVCVLTGSSGDWTDFWCNYDKYFVCEQPHVTTTSTTSSTSTTKTTSNDGKIPNSKEQFNFEEDLYDEKTMLLISVGVAGINIVIGCVVFLLLKHHYKDNH